MDKQEEGSGLRQLGLKRLRAQRRRSASAGLQVISVTAGRAPESAASAGRVTSVAPAVRGRELGRPRHRTPVGPREVDPPAARAEQL